MPSPTRRRFDLDEFCDVSIVKFTDRKLLDEQNIQTIGEQLFHLINDQGRHKLLLNFGDVEYLSSAALNKLIALNEQIKAVDGQLAMCHISPQIYEVFKITQLDKLFAIYEDERAALAVLLKS